MKVQKIPYMFLQYQYGCESSEDSEKLKDVEFTRLQEEPKPKVNDKLIVERQAQK